MKRKITTEKQSNMVLQIVPALLLAGVGGEVRTERGLAYTVVTMEDGLEMMTEEKDFILLDVRRQNEFAEGHIPGAINIPNELIEDKDIPALGRKDQRIFIYCRSGRRSKQAAMKLYKLGYTNLIEFGGILDYDGELEY